MTTPSWADSPIHEQIREAGLDKCEIEAERPLDAANCSRIVITLEITDPEIVADYRDTCDELLWEDLVDGELINFAEFVSRENSQAQPPQVG